MSNCVTHVIRVIRKKKKLAVVQECTKVKKKLKNEKKEKEMKLRYHMEIKDDSIKIREKKSIIPGMYQKTVKYK